MRFGYRFVWVLAAYALKHKRPDLSLAMALGIVDAIAGRMGRRDYWFLNVPRSGKGQIAKPVKRATSSR